MARKLACEGGVKTDLTEELLCLLEWLWYLVVGVAVILVCWSGFDTWLLEWL